MQLLIQGYRLQRTCIACPEQYDVFDQAGEQVAYFRLRHGRFTAEVPDCGGTTVYACQTLGDGIFDPSEAMPELKKAIKAVQKHIYLDSF